MSKYVDSAIEPTSTLKKTSDQSRNEKSEDKLSKLKKLGHTEIFLPPVSNTTPVSPVERFRTK